MTRSMFDKTENELIAEEYIDKATEVPWECSASDVRYLARRLAACEEERLAAEAKYGKVLAEHIDHSQAMLANVITLCLEKAEK